MTGPLASINRALAEFVDGVTDWQVDLLRRTATDMADALDRAAMRDVEGDREWRDAKAKRWSR